MRSLVALTFIAICTSGVIAEPAGPFEPTAAGLKGLSLEQLMNLDVTSVSRQPEPYISAPAALQVITGNDIERYGASSIPEALRLANNLNVVQVTSATWDISARGFNSSSGNKLLVLMDGRTIYTPLLSGVVWHVQDYLLHDLDRIEVISGPGGTLWGANAVNGVINIVSKDARDTQGLYVEGGGGSWLHDFAGLRYGGLITTNVFYRAYIKYFDRGPEQYADGTSAHDDWNHGQGGFRIDDERSTISKLTLQGDFYVGNVDTQAGGEGHPKAEGTDSGGNLLGRWTRTLAEDSDLSLQAYYDYAHLGAPFQSFGSIPPGIFRDDFHTFDLDFQHRFPIGDRNRVIWGLGYRRLHDLDENAPIIAFLPDDFSQNLFSGFVQDEIKLRENFFLTLGTKLEHNDYTGFEVEPNVRLHWHPTERQMLWGSVSRAVRTPSRFDRDLFEPNPQFGPVVIGTSNSMFQSESVIAYELGYRAELTKRISGSLSLFYNDYDDLRSMGTTRGAFPVVFENNLHGYTYGLEFSSDYQVLDWWRLHAGYNFLEEHIRAKNGAIDLGNGLGETADPKHQFFLRSSMDLPCNLEFNTALRLISTVHNNNGATAGTVPSYAELDARVAWHATKHLEVSVVGQNLLHDSHPEAGFPGPTQEYIVRSVYGRLAFQY